MVGRKDVPLFAVLCSIAKAGQFARVLLEGISGKRASHGGR